LFIASKDDTDESDNENKAENTENNNICVTFVIRPILRFKDNFPLFKEEI